MFEENDIEEDVCGLWVTVKDPILEEWDVSKRPNQEYSYAFPCDRGLIKTKMARTTLRAAKGAKDKAYGNMLPAGLTKPRPSPFQCVFQENMGYMPRCARTHALRHIARRRTRARIAAAALAPWSLIEPRPSRLHRPCCWDALLSPTSRFVSAPLVCWQLLAAAR